MAPVDLASLDDPALKTLIRDRLWSQPNLAPAAMWRDGRLAPPNPVPAAVLVPIVERPEGLTVLLTRRASHLAHHPGQISFPGGRLEPGDESAVGAALRETQEEIGLPRAGVEVAGFLPDHLVITGYRVTPVVGFVQPRFETRLDATEVAEVFEMPLRFLFDTRNHVRRVREFAGESVELTDLPYGSYHIWGATAGMLMTLWHVLREGARS